MSRFYNEARERQMRAEYHPRENGVHVCGPTPDELRPLTVANFPTRTAPEAVALFDRLKAEFAAQADEPSDLVVDLYTGGDIERDFGISRQMLERMRRAVEERAS